MPPLEAIDGLTARDAVTGLSAAVSFLGAALYAIVWQEIRASRRRGHTHSNWLTDHETWNTAQGKPPYQPKD